MKNRVRFMLLSLLGTLILVESASWALLRLIQYRDPQDHFFSYHLPNLHNNLTWFDKSYDFHPYLNYAPLDWDKRATEVHNKDTFVIAILGGSFAKGFAGFLTTDAGQKYVQEIKAETGITNFAFKNLAAGGFKQPQQLISSSLALDAADLFVSLEGYNEIWEASHGCLPQSWNLVGIRFHHGLLGRDAQIASGIKVLFKQIYDFSHSPFAVGKILAYFLAEPMVGLYQHYEARGLNHLSHDQVCKRLGLKPTPSIQDERFERIKIWSQFLKSHHQLHSKKRNLITILQPNIHLTGSKPLSPEEVKMMEGYHYDFVDEFYPHAKTALASLQKTQGLPVYDFTRIYEAHPETIYIDGCCHVGDLGNGIVFQNLKPILKETILRLHNLKSQPENNE